jgi:CO/xanthine dehydrogenase FAD-binding subunit
LIDLTRVQDLRGIRRETQGWWFGATCTWSDVLRAELPPLFDALRQAAREVGGEQIQNTGTLAGNLCNASPAADGIPVWLALNAQVHLHSARGRRTVAASEFVLGSRRTQCASDELVLGLQVPLHNEGARSVFMKLGGRRYLVISSTMLALCLDADAHAVVRRAGVAVGSCSARALRLGALEQRLIGTRLSALGGFAVGDEDLADLSPIDDLRATAAYRRDATLTLLRRALQGLKA